MEARLTFSDIGALLNNEKGTVGEVIAGIYLKNEIRKNPSLVADDVIDETDPRLWVSHVHGPTYLQRLVFELDSSSSDTGDETVTWEPDFSFEATLPDYDIKRRYFIEAKVGTSQPQGDQLRAMELAADQATPVRDTGLSQPTTPDTREVYLCNIQFLDSTVDLDYKKM